MKVKNIFKTTLILFILGLLLVPKININADTNDVKSVGDTTATISGTNYEINEKDKQIILTSDAIVELTGDAGNYKIIIEENAKDVSITLNNYTAITGGWANTIELCNGSSATVTLVGENTLQAGQEASAIRVPENTSLVIDGEGTLKAKVDNAGSIASSAVIGSQYNHPFGDITINNGNIYTYYTGNGQTTGIGAGVWHDSVEMSGTITLNGGNINTDVLGSLINSDKVYLEGNGSAVVYADNIVLNDDEFNGIIFNGNNGIVKGNATLNQDLDIPDGTVLTVEEDASLTIPSNVTMINNGNIVNNGTINNTGNFKNNGEIESTDGNIISSTEIENVNGEVKIILYNITIKVGTGGSIDPSIDFTVRYGENKTFNILPDKGYKIKSVIVNDMDKTDEIINNELTLLNIIEDTTINVEFEKLPDVSSKIYSIDSDIIGSDTIENPETHDNILLYVGLGLVSIIGLILVIIYFKKVFKQ